MASKFLRVYMQNARSTLRALLGRLVARRVTQRQALMFCQAYRQLAIGSLLMDMDTKAFSRHLARSGRAYLHFARGAADKDKVTSRAEPFFDAVASGDADGALAIAESASHAHKRGVEYEEDFLYMRFLMRRLEGESPLRATPEEETASLERWHHVLEGSRDERIDVCRALSAKDERAFAESLDQWMTAKAQRTERLAAGERLLPEEVATEGRVSIEGVALIVLANRAGLATKRDVLLVPSPALPKAPPAMAPDAWMDVDA